MSPALIWSGLAAEYCAKKTGTEIPETGINQSLTMSLLTGAIITLSDQKALLFYFAFFPAFLDVTAISSTDIYLILLITALAVGGSKLGYAYLAGKTGGFSGLNRHGAVHSVAGTLLCCLGLFLIVTA